MKLCWNKSKQTDRSCNKEDKQALAADEMCFILQDRVFQDLGEGILENALQVEPTVFHMLIYNTLCHYVQIFQVMKNLKMTSAGLQRHIVSIRTDGLGEELFHDGLRAEQRPGS